MKRKVSKEKLSQDKKVYMILAITFLFAFSLRCFMPLYLIKTHDYYRDYMISSSHSFDLIAVSIALAKGEGLHTDYFSYAVNFVDIRTSELENIKRENVGRLFHFGKGGISHFLLTGAITWFMNSFDIPIIQMFQGVIDSIGCIYVFCIICFFFDKRIGLIGALIYAIYPAFIFNAYHLMSETYIPFFMLAIGYTFIVALDNDKWFWFGLAGFLLGLSFSFRSDNILILPLYIIYLLCYYRSRIKFGLSRAGIVLLFCGLSIMPFTVIDSEKINNSPVLGIALYNSLGEYPGTYQDLRFFHDQATLKHGLKKVNEYTLKGDALFNTMRLLPLYNSLSLSNDKEKAHLITLAYVKEVIFENPFLYLDWIVRRFFAYLPSHPFIACITYFLKTGSMEGYRYSQIFQSVKYIDYLFFIMFGYGIWLSRKNKKLLSLLCIYFGVLISHVILGGGEVYFRMDKEFAYLDPRYLLGMVSIWPIFIAVALKKCFNLKLSQNLCVIPIETK